MNFQNVLPMASAYIPTTCVQVERKPPQFLLPRYLVFVILCVLCLPSHDIIALYLSSCVGVIVYLLYFIFVILGSDKCYSICPPVCCICPPMCCICPPVCIVFVLLWVSYLSLYVLARSSDIDWLSLTLSCGGACGQIMRLPNKSCLSLEILMN